AGGIECVFYRLTESEQCRHVGSINAKDFADEQARPEWRAIECINRRKQTLPGRFHRAEYAAKKVRKRRWAGCLAVGKTAHNSHDVCLCQLVQHNTQMQ